jgi:hypothetical protein
MVAAWPPLIIGTITKTRSEPYRRSGGTTQEAGRLIAKHLGAAHHDGIEIERQRFCVWRDAARPPHTTKGKASCSIEALRTRPLQSTVRAVFQNSLHKSGVFYEQGKVACVRPFLSPKCFRLS